MTMIVAVAVGIPCLLLLAWLGMRRIQSLPFARSLAYARGGDMRGIALQTIIIMVVLLAIAGTVAGVLLNRAGQETARLEEQSINDPAYSINAETLCRSSGYTWVETHVALTSSSTGAWAGHAAGLGVAEGLLRARGPLSANTGYCHPH